MSSISRTAQYVALYRALETVERRRAPLFRDPLAINFLAPSLALAVRAAARSRRLHSLIERYADYRAPGARTSAIGRTAIIDGIVTSATREGIDQLVILGAGFDCRAHRLPELAEVSVFEVDREATQAEKRARVAMRFGLHYAAVDFLRDDVAERLRSTGWDESKPTLFLWEGVTNYLSEDAVFAMLRWIGQTAPRSTLVFTYIHAGLLDGTTPFEGAARMLSNVRQLGEPWTYGIHPRELGALVARFGLRLRDDMGADEYRQRAGLDDGGRGYAFYRLAVTERSSVESRA